MYKFYYNIRIFGILSQTITLFYYLNYYLRQNGFKIVKMTSFNILFVLKENYIIR